AAQAGSEVIQLQRGNRRGIELPGVESAVAQVLINRAVEFVAAALGHHAHLASSHPAYVRAVDGAAGLELSNGLQGELQASRFFNELMVDACGVDTVEAEVIILLGETGKPDGVLRTGSGADCAGDQRHQACPVSAVHGKGLSLATLDDSANLRRGLVQVGRGRYYAHLGTDGANLHDRVDSARLAHIEGKCVDAERLESVRDDRHGIGANGQRTNSVGAGRVCFGAVFQSCGDGMQNHLRPLDYSLGWIGYSACHSGAVCLRNNRNCQKDKRTNSTAHWL